MTLKRDHVPTWRVYALADTAEDRARNPQGDPMKHVRTAALALLATGLVAGCGSSSSSSSTSTPAATSTPSTASTASTPAATTATTDTAAGTTSIPASAAAAVKAAVASCQSSIDAQPTLDASLKSDLKKICEKAASGDEKAAREATKEVCTKIIEANVPAGAARDQALAACKSAGG